MEEKETQVDLYYYIELKKKKYFEARYPYTAVPSYELIDWWGTRVIWDKIAEKNLIDQEDKDKFVWGSGKQFGLMAPDLWEFTDRGFEIVGMAIQDWRRIDRVKKVFKEAPVGIRPEDLSLISKKPYYYFQFNQSKALPFGVLSPTLAPVPTEHFDKLHAMKRGIEWVSGQLTLGEILMDSTGPDYFYSGANPQELDEAVRAYAEYVKRVPNPSGKGYVWVPPPDDVVKKLTKNVKFENMQQTIAVRINELTRLKIAKESGLPYTSKIKVVGDPRIYISMNSGIDQTGKPYPPELTFEWQEETKVKLLGPLGAGQNEVRKFRMTVQVETEVRSLRYVDQSSGKIVGALNVRAEGVKSMGKVANFVIELSAEQKALNNERLKNVLKDAFQKKFPDDWQSKLQALVEYEKGGIGYPAGGPFPPRPAPSYSVEDLVGEQLAIQSVKVWGAQVLKGIAKDVWKTGVFGAVVYTLVRGLGETVDGFEKEGMYGAFKGFCGILWQGTKAALLEVVVGKFGQTLAKMALESLEARIAATATAWETSFLRVEAAAGAKASLSLETVAMTETLVQTGKLPLMAAKLLTRAGVRLVPIIGLIPLFLDWNDFTKEFFDTWYAPPSDEEVAWKDPLRTVTQQQKDDVLIVQRGQQVMSTDLVDAEPSQSYYQLRRVYKSLIVPRGTKTTLKDSTSIEIADEIVDPKSEYLPQVMRDRLPDLPTEVLFTYTFRKPAILATVDDLSYLGIKTEDGVKKFLKDNPSITFVMSQKTEAGKIDPYKAAQNPMYFLGKVNTEISNSGVPNAKEFGFGGLSEARALAYNEWGKWRDKYATKWVRIEHLVPGHGLMRMIWWKDFTGQKYTIIETRDSTMILPSALDLNVILEATLPQEDLQALHKLTGINFSPDTLKKP